MKKILHVCLANYYSDGHSYQENILPLEHSNLGYHVEILASTEVIDQHSNLYYVDSGSYFNEHNIKVTRLDYRKFFTKFLTRKLRLYIGTFNFLQDLKPDIIFIHDIQFLDIFFFRKYLRINSDVKIYIDCHADFKNSARSFISKYILHKIIYKFCAKLIEKEAVVFWGVLPSRVAFLKDVYKIAAKKVQLLNMGGEELKITQAFLNVANTKEKYKIPSDSIIFLTGGKIDQFKFETLDFINAFSSIDNNNIYLIIFGSLSDNLLNRLSLIDDNRIKYLGWLKSDEIYNLLAISDIAVFPGRHSVLWEQAVASGVPLMIPRFSGADHLDIGGNIAYLDNNFMDMSIKWILNNNNLNKLRCSSSSNLRKQFYYSNIAKRSIMVDQDFLN